jgi:hypothetical protein
LTSKETEIHVPAGQKNRPKEQKNGSKRPKNMLKRRKRRWSSFCREKISPVWIVSFFAKMSSSFGC